ncbi:IucA/IucC family protein [Paenibacillus herberti]|uniref:IucA/IucC family siderophore biosynthesis protein n=1 Tax=Paenibacillus herberti TaxID=1619309 RepID=A0A229P002_9BACL|nr:IucA/IucC family protein [Paenibacillus herberti]OXM15586.1 hypothetical protein CGZ75_02285 [Paenibacillus herberti]
MTLLGNRQLEAQKWANQHTCRTLLNCYAREFRQESSFTESSHHYAISFPASGVVVSGKLARWSAIGEHRYESYTASTGQELDSADLALWITKELGKELPMLTTELQEQFFRNVAGSKRNLALFMEQVDLPRMSDYRTSEQSLLHGHPFHPFPKNTLGFSEADVRHYCPELRASFQLCYVAVRHDVFEEEWVAEERRIEPPREARDQALIMLQDSVHLYKLLPIHPWQYEHVQSMEEVQDYIGESKIVLLGNCGPLCYPTSSVRTVYVPELSCNIKLSLDVQITNMRRTNSREQMRRTMDAAAFLLRSRCFENEKHTAIAYEEGVASCRMGRDELTALFTIAYRPVEFDLTSTYVMSSLIETAAGEEQPLLASLLQVDHAEDWFRRYLEISLLPIVRIADEKGIHFEAHLQNTLLTVKDEMPHTFIIRDLEGVSVNRDKVGLPAEGPLFYSKEQAWARTSYYFIINHLGSFIHAMATVAECKEERFWSIVQDVLGQELARSGNEYVRHLLTAESFLAKRNMASCLAGVSETPTYVPVDNLMKRVGSVVDVTDKQLV